MIDIAVVDYGMGNLRSVAKALEHVARRKSSRSPAIRRRSARQAGRVSRAGRDAGLHA